MLKVMYVELVGQGPTVAVFWHGSDMVARVEWDGSAYVVVYFEGFEKLDIDAGAFDALVNTATERLRAYHADEVL